MQKFNAENIKVAIIGNGNVAFHLFQLFKGFRFEKLAIFARNKKEYLDTKKLSNFPKNHFDWVIFAVKDDAIEPLSEILKDDSSAHFHVSGSTNISVLKSSNKGVFYPLQTFSLNKKVMWDNIPIIIETNNEDLENVLFEFASSISSETKSLSSKERLNIHLAAVFACNFTNSMLAEAYNILHKHNIPFSYVKPLLDETLEKAFIGNPIDYQTGPAIRNDQQIIQAHKEILKGNSLAAEIYSNITSFIQKRHHGEKL